MNMTKIRTNDQHEVRDDVAAALAMVEELDPPDDLRQIVFTQVVQLLTHRMVVQPQQPVGIPLDASLLRGGNGRR